MSSTLILIVIALLVGFVAWLFFLWAVKSGQYDDVEGPKYRMMDDDDLETTNKPKINAQDKEKQK